MGVVPWWCVVHILIWVYGGSALETRRFHKVNYIPLTMVCAFLSPLTHRHVLDIWSVVFLAKSPAAIWVLVYLHKSYHNNGLPYTPRGQIRWPSRYRTPVAVVIFDPIFYRKSVHHYMCNHWLLMQVINDATYYMLI